MILKRTAYIVFSVIPKINIPRRKRRGIKPSYESLIQCFYFLYGQTGYLHDLLNRITELF